MPLKPVPYSSNPVSIKSNSFLSAEDEILPSFTCLSVNISPIFSPLAPSTFLTYLPVGLCNLPTLVPTPARARLNKAPSVPNFNLFNNLLPASSLPSCQHFCPSL